MWKRIFVLLGTYAAVTGRRVRECANESGIRWPGPGASVETSLVDRLADHLAAIDVARTALRECANVPATLELRSGASVETSRSPPGGASAASVQTSPYPGWRAKTGVITSARVWKRVAGAWRWQRRGRRRPSRECENEPGRGRQAKARVWERVWREMACAVRQAAAGRSWRAAGEKLVSTLAPGRQCQGQEAGGLVSTLALRSIGGLERTLIAMHSHREARVRSSFAHSRAAAQRSAFGRSDSFPHSRVAKRARRGALDSFAHSRPMPAAGKSGRKSAEQPEKSSFAHSRLIVLRGAAVHSVAKLLIYQEVGSFPHSRWRGEPGAVHQRSTTRVYAANLLSCNGFWSDAGGRECEMWARVCERVSTLRRGWTAETLAA